MCRDTAGSRRPSREKRQNRVGLRISEETDEIEQQRPRRRLGTAGNGANSGSVSVVPWPSLSPAPVTVGPDRFCIEVS